MESSKATAEHIRQVAGDLLAAQIQLMQHQHTQLPARKYPRRKQTSTVRRKPQNHKSPEIPTSQKPSDLQQLDVHSDKYTRCGDTLHAKGFQCPARKFHVNYVTNLDISLQYVIRKANSHQVPLKQENPKHSNFMQGPYAPTTMLTKVDLKHQTLKIHSAYR